MSVNVNVFGVNIHALFLYSVSVLAFSSAASLRKVEVTSQK